MFKELFKSNTTTIDASSAKKEDAIKRLISRHSNGNVNLQHAKYLTKKMLKEKQSKIFSYKFA